MCDYWYSSWKIQPKKSKTSGDFKKNYRNKYQDQPRAAWCFNVDLG
jgi:hypothetical protein